MKILKEFCDNYKTFSKVSFYENNLNKKWNVKVEEWAMIALYHCAHDDVN